MKKMLVMTSMFAIVTGIILVCGGIWGIGFTYMNVAQEKITTSKDSSMPNQPVLGPLTLKAEADVIREHTLTSTGGLVYAEMPRQVPKLDANGKPIMGSDGKPVMVANTARDMWITATTLTTALNLGIITYAFSGMVLLMGLISIWTGFTFFGLSKKF